MIRSDASTVRMPAVRTRDQQDLADAMRLLTAIRRIALGSESDHEAMATALGRIAGLTAHSCEFRDCLRSAAATAEGYVDMNTGDNT